MMLLNVKICLAAAVAFLAIPALSAAPAAPVLTYAFKAHVLVGKPVGPIPANEQLTIGLLLILN